MLRSFGPVNGDHPRVSGEHTAVGTGSLIVLGSSPRERGAHNLVGDMGDVGGIIPA